MSIDSEDFFYHAQKLALCFRDEEIDRRCAISRGYYSVFHYVRENGRSNGLSNFSDGSGDHSEAVDFLYRLGKSKLSTELSDIQEWRENADYELEHDIGKRGLDTFFAIVRKYRQKLKSVSF